MATLPHCSGSAPGSPLPARCGPLRPDPDVAMSSLAGHPDAECPRISTPPSPSAGTRRRRSTRVRTSATRSCATLDAPFDWAPARSEPRRHRRCGRAARARGRAAPAAAQRVPPHARPRPDRARRPPRSLRRHDHARGDHAAQRALAPSRCARRGLRRAARREGRRAGARDRRHGQARRARAQRVVRHRSRLRLPGRRRDGRRADARQSRILRAPRPARHRRAARDHAGRLRLPRRRAAPSLRRERAARRALFGARAVPHHAGTRVGALRVAQGARADRPAAWTSSTRSSRRSCSASTSTSTPTTACATSTARSREQGRRHDYAQNIKLGPGGIREIEFIVQALQLVRGGREPALRASGTLPALAAAAERGLLPAAAIAALRDAYCYLRKLEHRLQYRDDRQTQTLPAEAAEREALARAMGRDGVDAFDRELAAHRAAVSAQFAELFGAAAGRDAPARPAPPAPLPKRATRRRRPHSPRSGATRRRAAGARDAGRGRLCRSRGAARESHASPREPAVPAVARAVAAAGRHARAGAARGRGGRARGRHGSADAVLSPVRSARDREPAQRLPRAPDRASGDPAAPRAADGRVAMGGGLPDAPSDPAGRAARSRACCWPSPTGTRGAASSRACSRRTRETPSGRWTCSATFTTRNRFACSRRISPAR